MTRFELLVQDSLTGSTWDISKLTTSAKLTTKRAGSASSLNFGYLGESVNASEGSSVRLTIDGIVMFYGYVFKRSRNRYGEVSATAYDRGNFA